MGRPSKINISSPHTYCQLPSFSRISEHDSLQRTDLEHGWASSDSVVGYCCVAAGQDNIGLAADWCGTIGRSGHGERETASNRGGP